LLIEPVAGVVLPVLPDVPLPGVDALVVAAGTVAVSALLPIEPLLPVEPLLFFRSLPEDPLPVALLPMLPLPVVPLPVVLLPILPLPILLPVEPLPVVPDIEPVLLPGMSLLVSTMMISLLKVDNQASRTDAR
jgi:hypothetical protein